MMPARGQATFGDALIFITKALFATVALVIVAVTAYAVLATWTTTEQKLSEAHAQILTREDTIAELGEKLNACLVRTGSAPSGAELKAPGKPWERDWSPPDPPEGFVVDQPNPFEAELRRREDSSAAGER